MLNIRIFFQTLLFILFIGYVIYSKLFHKNLNIYLYNMNNATVFLHYALIIFGISSILTLYFLLLILNVFVKHELNSTLKINPLYSFLVKRIEIIIKTFYNVYGLIFEFFSPKYTYYLLHFADKFAQQISYYTIICLIFDALPRSIIIITFFFDIYNQHLYYYFYTLPLLLIPFLFRILVFMLKDVGLRLAPEFKKFLNFEKKNVLSTENTEKYYSLVNITLKKEHQDLNLDHVLKKYYYPAIFSYPVIETKFVPRYSKIRAITFLCYYFFTAIGWGYIISMILIFNNSS